MKFNSIQLFDTVKKYILNHSLHQDSYQDKQVHDSGAPAVIDEQLVFDPFLLIFKMSS